MLNIWHFRVCHWFSEDLISYRSSELNSFKDHTNVGCCNNASLCWDIVGNHCIDPHQTPSTLQETHLGETFPGWKVSTLFFVLNSKYSDNFSWYITLLSAAGTVLRWPKCWSAFSIVLVGSIVIGKRFLNVEIFKSMLLSQTTVFRYCIVVQLRTLLSFLHQVKDTPQFLKG